MKKVVVGAACAAVLVMSGAAHAQFDFGGDSFDFLDVEEVEKVYEKLDPIIISVKPENTHTWACRDVQLEEHCGDLDGCTVKLHLQNKVAGNDHLYGINEHIFMENQSVSAQKKNTVYGYTRQSAGGEHHWQTGGNVRYTMFAPWGWLHMLNYKHVYCPDQSPGHGKAYSDPYKFTFLSHPHVHSIIIIED